MLGEVHRIHKSLRSSSLKHNLEYNFKMVTFIE